MEKFEYVDLFSTKGATYILVILFLISFTFFIKYINGKPAKSLAAETIKETKLKIIGWFQLAQDYFYHQGHGWAFKIADSKFKIGLDDFAQKLLGISQEVIPIKLGGHVEQGTPFVKLKYGEKFINILSPVSGKITAINNLVIREPSLINKDPYQKGWLLEIESTNFVKEKTNLLHGNLANSWIEETAKSLNRKITGHQDLVLQDGGEIMSGFIRELEPENWEKIAKEYLLN